MFMLFAAPGLRAEPPVALYGFPAGGQRGQTVNVRVGGLFLHDRCSFDLSGPGVTASHELKRTRTLWLEGPLLPLPDSQRQEDYPQDMAGQVKIAADATVGSGPGGCGRPREQRRRGALSSATYRKSSRKNCPAPRCLSRSSCR